MIRKNSNTSESRKSTKNRNNINSLRNAVKVKKWFISSTAFISAAAIGIAAFSGCGSASAASGKAESEARLADYADDEMYSNAENVTEDAASGYSSINSDYSADTLTDGTFTDETAVTETEAEDIAPPENAEVRSETDRKLIVTWSITMETEKYDDAAEEIRDSVDAAGGYIESESETAYSDEDRYLSLTIRIPGENADNWVDGAASFGTIVTRSKDTEDATLQYVDTESRLEALRTEQTALLSMMERAEEMSDVITIQSELTEVNAEIESYESSLRYLDNQVDYTTVYLDVEEVSRETAVKQTFGQEIRETFLNSIDGLKCTFRNLAVGIIGNSVIILLAAVIAAAVVLIVRKAGKILRRRKVKRHSGDQAPKSDIPDQVKDPEESERS